jgi:hypothetical protein
MIGRDGIQNARSFSITTFEGTLSLYMGINAGFALCSCGQKICCSQAAHFEEERH